MSKSVKNSVVKTAGKSSESAKSISKCIMTACFPSSSAAGEMPVEENETPFIAKIFLLKTPVEDCNLLTKKLIDPQHWALVIEFPGFFCIIDGNSNDDGVLIGRYKREFDKPEGEFYRLNEGDLLKNHDSLENPATGAVHGGILGFFYTGVSGLIAKGARSLLPEIDCVKMSRAQVYRVARDNALNGKKYVVALNDCQKWAIEAATVIKNNYEYKE